MSELTEEQLAHLSKDDRILVLKPPDKISGGKRKRRKRLLEKIFSEEPPKSGKDNHDPCELTPSQEMTWKKKNCQDPGNKVEQQQAPKGVSPACSSEKGKKIDSKEIPWYGDFFEQEEFNNLDSSLPFLAFDDQAVGEHGSAGSSGRESASSSPPPALSSTVGSLDSNADARQSKHISFQTLDESQRKIDSNLLKYRRSFELQDRERDLLSPEQLYLFSLKSNQLSGPKRKCKYDLIDMFRRWRESEKRPEMVSYSMS